MGLGNSEVSQEQTHGLAPHRAATVRVKGELVGFNVLLATALGDEALGERGTFSVSQHPANHVAGEDVEDDVEVVVGPLDGATKLRDIPRPNLVRRFGQQLRLGVVRMASLVPALSDLAVLRRCCTALAESEIRLWWWPRYVSSTLCANIAETLRPLKLV